MTVRQIVHLLQKDGWIHKATKGSHAQFVHLTKPGKVTVPIHHGDIPIETAKSILKQAGINKEN